MNWHRTSATESRLLNPRQSIIARVWLADTGWYCWCPCGGAADMRGPWDDESAAREYCEAAVEDRK